MDTEIPCSAESPIYLPPLPVPPGSEPQTEEAADLPVRSSAEARLLRRLLKMADGYRASHALRQAVEMYFQLAERHPDTPEASQARDRLFEIGEGYERAGELRQARGIYERLL